MVSVSARCCMIGFYFYTLSFATNAQEIYFSIHDTLIEEKGGSNTLLIRMKRNLAIDTFQYDSIRNGVECYSIKKYLNGEKYLIYSKCTNTLIIFDSSGSMTEASFGDTSYKFNDNGTIKQKRYKIRDNKYSVTNYSYNPFLYAEVTWPESEGEIKVIKRGGRGNEYEIERKVGVWKFYAINTRFHYNFLHHKSIFRRKVTVSPSFEVKREVLQTMDIMTADVYTLHYYQRTRRVIKTANDFQFFFPEDTPTKN